uniref:Hyaluronidase n=1 Tax=Strongyloides papillosus TaxID=174720 RepID=A0A0N5B3B6_STREA
MPSQRTFNNLKYFFLLIYVLKFYVFPTKILWNIPSEQCERTNSTKIDFSKYKIETNYHCKFRGEKIIVLYENDVGLYPHLKNFSNGTIQYINGGLPQLVNISEHLKKLGQSIKNIITDKHFNGLAIIDIEEWRPTYDSNWSSKRVYQEESVRLVLKDKKFLNKTEAINLAKLQFDKAAFRFFYATLKMCKLLRPRAFWGFYGFPTCNENAQNRNWSFCFPEISNKMISFLKYADVIYPSPYIVPGQNYTVKSFFVREVLKETNRIVEEIMRLGYGKKLIYVYNKIEVDPFVAKPKNIEFFDPYYLCIVYDNCVLHNVDGVIVWSTSKNMKERCHYIKDYVDHIFGPHIKFLQLYSQ